MGGGCVRARPRRCRRLLRLADARALDVAARALQIHGSLGYTHDTPLARWYTEVRGQRLVDGPDEVHTWRVSKHVIDTYRSTGSTAPATGGDLL